MNDSHPSSTPGPGPPQSGDAAFTTEDGHPEESLRDLNATPVPVWRVQVCRGQLKSETRVSDIALTANKDMAAGLAAATRETD
jgi:hypothetical protein